MLWSDLSSKIKGDAFASIANLLLDPAVGIEILCSWRSHSHGIDFSFSRNQCQPQSADVDFLATPESESESSHYVGAAYHCSGFFRLLPSCKFSYQTLAMRNADYFHITTTLSFLPSIAAHSSTIKESPIHCSVMIIFSDVTLTCLWPYLAKVWPISLQ